MRKFQNSDSIAFDSKRLGAAAIASDRLFDSGVRASIQHLINAQE